MNNWALCISREIFSCKTWLWVSKIKMNKQVAHHRALSYSSSPHHHLYFSISSLLQSWWFTSAPPCNTLLAQILTIKSSQKKMWMMTTKSMPYIRLTSNTTVQTSAVCNYHSSMSMIEKNAKKWNPVAVLWLWQSSVESKVWLVLEEDSFHQLVYLKKPTIKSAVKHFLQPVYANLKSESMQKSTKIVNSLQGSKNQNRSSFA